ncbi:MAG: twin-arginine translocation signal domain-containing protein [Proteobacteria bacterium]|nr:twin-arginine translocation signal domain-containing protein [Pseudomonadota bacterium]
MTNSSGEKKSNRRDFLKIATTAPVAVVATVTGADAALAETALNQGSGMRDTLHVQTYYKSARF